MQTQPTLIAVHHDHAVSRRTIEHLCALDMVEGVLDAVHRHVLPKLVGTDKHATCSSIVAEITKAQRACRKLTDDTDFALWRTGCLRRYVRALDKIRREVHRAWPPGHGVNSIEFLYACITLVAEIEGQLPRSQNYIDERLEWGRLHYALHALYTAFDPDYEGDEEVRRGCDIGEIIRREVRG